MAINDIGQNWKRDTPINTLLKLNLTYDRSLKQWSFPILFGTPSQTLNLPIDIASNLIWVVSQFCMSPYGNACDYRTTNFFNSSLSNCTGNYTTFKTKYNDIELTGVWVNDIIMINNQPFERISFGLPMNIKGNDNITIPDIIAGQIGLAPYQNNQIVGIALSTNLGSITFGGIDLEYIKGHNESNIVYQPLPHLTDSNNQFMINVTNIYINNKPINISGIFRFDNEIQNIKLDNNSINIIANQSKGGNISFEIANTKWILPKMLLIGRNGTESIITGGAEDIDSWIFGNAFIQSFYIVLDQSKSQFGIANRSDIDYGFESAS
ncbi:aspartic peptidase domain-containing protein [Gigaspora rosea]|uniref:Aspartic peptidase domain-containing protein n=1 Tax=Gigaspora rosea TaxID=44941 RepID=A0A397VU31_9GLOM|nr:aspartic peptidase domain-containing protein [Gigaspora rosea]